MHQGGIVDVRADNLQPADRIHRFVAQVRQKSIGGLPVSGTVAVVEKRAVRLEHAVIPDRVNRVGGIVGVLVAEHIDRGAHGNGNAGGSGAGGRLFRIGIVDQRVAVRVVWL